MNSSIFFGGSVLAAMVAGAIALFAPCCISVMLPAYFASSFPNWLGALIFLVLLGGLAWYALRQIGVWADRSREPLESIGTNETVETEEPQAIQEEPIEY